MQPNLAPLRRMNLAMDKTTAAAALRRLENFRQGKVKTAKMGRPAVLKRCPKCDARMPSRKLLLHQGTCDGTAPPEAAAPQPSGAELSMANLAVILNVSRETLRLWQKREYGPQAIVTVTPRRVTYDPNAVEAWLREIAS